MIPPETKKALQRLQGTVTDGRLANPFFRREQLARLHDKLQAVRGDILAAIVRDTPKHTSAEALAELYMVLCAVKKLHDQIQPARELELEYRISKGKDAVEARVGVGIVAIAPPRTGEHGTFTCCLIAPLCAAIAAGNGVIIVMEDNSSRTLPSLLSRILHEALDPEIFEITQQLDVDDIQSNDDTDNYNNIIYVDQRGGAADAQRSSTKFLCSPPSESLAIAIVDRDANLVTAAESIVRARFAFGGTSPYAPDIVLVNEFAEDAFLRVLSKYVTQYLDVKDERVNGQMGGKYDNEISSISDEVSDKGFRTVMSRSNAAIITIEDRNALGKFNKAARKKTTKNEKQCIYVYPFSSLEHAIETANSLVHRPEGNGSESALATYVFGHPKTCKYVLQFVDTDVGFANMIPTELLVGPAIPKGYSHDVDISLRYTTSMFSVPRPRYAIKSRLSRELQEILTISGRDAEYGESSKLLTPALALEKRAPPPHIFGYFERGVLVGGIASALSVLLGLGAMTYCFAGLFMRWVA